MSENDAWDNILDESDLDIPSDTAPAPGRGKPPLDAREVLPRILLESVLDKAALKEMKTCEAYCLVVRAPAIDWIEPIGRYLTTLGKWNFHYLARTAPARSRNDDMSDRAVAVLAAGGRAFGVAATPEFLPPAMTGSADRTVVLPVPSDETIAKVIKAVTGSLPVDVPAQIGKRLGFDDLVACIRRNSTAPECVDRLVKAAAAKSGANDDAGVPRFEDLHGLGAAREWGLELIEDLGAWRRGEIPWSAISSTVVLASEPGLGKTSMARSLAKSAGVSFISTSVANWFSTGTGYLDSTIKQIDRAFAEARAKAPALILLDEIDALPSRLNASKNADYWNVVVTHMLTVLDGALADTTENLIIVAATNHASKLDPALLRPGRFGRTIHIEPPDERALEGIIRQHLGKDLEGFDLSGAARLASGVSGATVVEFVRSARRKARQAGRTMEPADLLDTIAPPDPRTAATLERIALHEAGHAVAAHALGLGSVTAISLVRRGDTGGFALIEGVRDTPTREGIENLVVQCLAGRAAEEAVLGQAGTGSGGAADSDLANATRLLGILHLSSGLGDTLIYQADPQAVALTLARNRSARVAVETELRRLYAIALALVREHADIIVAVSGQLQERRYLSGEQFKDIVAGVPVPPAGGASIDG